jgi:predicted RNase H-like nuclease
MARKRYKPEEIVAKLRQVDVLVLQGQGMTEAIRQIGVSEVTYYRWRWRRSSNAEVSEAFFQPRHAVQRPHCLAGHIGFELANPGAGQLIVFA